jgi:hypothetical protein
MRRYLGIAVVFALIVPIAAYLLGAAVPTYPKALLVLVIFLCPAYPLFVATAACKHFDACSLSTLGWVLASNVLLYAFIAAVLWFTRQSFRPVGYIVVGAVAFASAWWATFWA